MNVGDIMTVGAATVSPKTTIAQAAQLMLEHHISGLPVVDESGQLVGMVTEKDLLRRAELGTEPGHPHWMELVMSASALADQYVRANARTIEDVMSRDVVQVGPDMSLADLVALMEKHGFRRLPVVENGKLTGIVARSNFLRALVRRAEGAPASSADDLEIRTQIVEEIRRRGWVPTSAIEVIVTEGVVELKGAVIDERIRDALRVIAENTAGVKSVEDHIEIVPAMPGWM
ncbi:CBS domain-containing protein [Amorphus orientalis]|uniref:CBS domain-containing protein n=1 Tax=Amorphus orientalis TaxID=649198 RepID=A0AAE3VR72_9HYPH|nr:CBS domain-containing protein [Amorphus orientalis]MDQ0316700.1 CBS domain-containing protein [Amorphus orientalis]